MDITKIIEILPTSVKLDVMDFTTVRLKTGEIATRIILTRVLTDEEKTELLKNNKIAGFGVGSFSNFPEDKKSYFYLKY
jgi:hypothetical protein